MRSADGSTGRLIQLCIGYFVFYVVTGVMVKYFLSSAAGRPGMSGIEYLAYSTLGGAGLVFPIVIAMKWHRIASNGSMQWGPLRFPRELVVIVPSGVCTAVVIPTTTLMYTLPITVMVAMTIMRGSVIVASRLVDAVLIRQGILTKKVYLEENLAVGFALGAVGVHVVYGSRADGGFDFLSNPAALTIFLAYIGAYAVRLYLMNYFKNTRAKGVPLDNKGFFALEQFAATAVLVIAAVLAFGAPDWFGSEAPQVVEFSNAVRDPHSDWTWASIGGTAFGASAFFSVFIFMYKGRTATFAGLVNRLTSLIAGTVATLLFWLIWGGSGPDQQDWIALGFVLVAVGFLSRAERKRAAELARESE